MREIVRQIKKGNLKFYVSLIEGYIGPIYQSSYNAFGESKASEITIKIFEKLYIDIVSSFGFQNAEKLIISSLKGSCKRYDISFNLSQNTTTDIPPQVMRMLFVKLSQKSKHNSSKQISIVAAAVVLVAVLLSVSSNFVNTTKQHIGSIQNINANQEIIHQLYYSDINPSTTISNIISLEDKGVLVDIQNDQKHICEIWYQGEKVKEFSLRESGIFKWGSFSQDCLVFESGKRLYKYSLRGELKDSAEVAGSNLVKSVNKQYSGYLKDGKCSIFDMKSFKFVSTYNDKVLAISNTGYVITSKGKVNTEANKREKRVVNIKAISHSKAVVVYDDGEVALYDNDMLVWQKQLVSKEIKKKMSVWSDSVKNAYAFGDENTINVIVEFSGAYIMQSYDSFDGTERINNFDAYQVGRFLRAPSVSADNKILSLESRIFYNNKETTSSGLALFDISSDPVVRVGLEDKHVLYWATEDADDERYVYISNNNYLKILKLKMSDLD